MTICKQKETQVSVRKRTWKTAAGETREAWLADYTGQDGSRHAKTFDRKKDAESFIANAKVEVIKGVHTTDFESVTVAKAAEHWLSACEDRGLERATVETYRCHTAMHIIPFIGKLKLSKLSAPMVRELEDRLRKQGRSAAMTRKIMTSLSSLLGDAMERGLVARNVVRELGSRRRNGAADRAANRQKGNLKVGVNIPTREEIKAIVASLQGPWRPFLLTAIFTGLRASELRGLRWADVDLPNKVLHVRQRADKFNALGAPKSAASARTLPLTPYVVTALRQQSLLSRGEIVFTSPRGKVLALSSVIASGWHPAQIAAGVVDKNGKTKYTGLHALRHFYASWLINSVQDGGQGLSAKAVQGRLGHSTINMTLNTYSHLFPAIDEQEQVAAAERSLLA
jgi:integrase